MNHLLLSAAVKAQVLAQDLPNVPNPAPKAPPGADVFNVLIGWGKWLAIGFGVLFIIAGAIAAGLAKASNNPTARIGAGRVVGGGMMTAGIAAAASFFIAVALWLAQSIG